MKKMLITLTALMLVAGTIAGTARAEEPTDPKKSKTVNLLESKDLADWDFFLVDPDVKMTDVWSFNDDGVLTCKGEPMGYLCTKEKYKNFKLKVEWRWPEEPGNSGVLMRIGGEPKPLPHCVEAQLKSGSAGDLYGFHGFMIDGPDATQKDGGDFTGKMCAMKKLVAAEKKPGEWNTFDITAQDGVITVMLNGKLVNKTTDAENKPGLIGIQSEGGIGHYRTIEITPLD